jgi:hypothetical protein
VSLKNAAAVAAVESFTATISGAGTLGAGDGTVTGGLMDVPNPTGRALTFATVTSYRYSLTEHLVSEL